MVAKKSGRKAARAKSRTAAGQKHTAKRAATPASRQTASRSGVQKTASGVLVVNMIPKSLSGEDNQDSEPTIAVNLANPLQIAASAFTPDPAGSGRAPIYVSTDGGNTWTLNAIVPSTVADRSQTADITVAFGSSSSVLYAGIIRFPIINDKTRLNILRTSNFQSTTTMQVLEDRTGQGVDQPYVQAATVASGPDRGKDRVYVGDNDFNAPGGRTATIDQSLNGASANATFKKIRIESRVTSGQDGPSVRPTIHPDGTVYAAFHAWRSFDGTTGQGTADIVVLRDDHGGTGASQFTNLIDPNDNKAGMRVVRGAKFNFNGFLGQQRTGGDVAITVDPTNRKNVYLAYNDDQPGGIYGLHLFKSTDAGQTWTANFRPMLRNALNPGLAVNSDGKLGFLYQQLTGTGTARTWVTKFEILKPNGTSETVFVLHQAPDGRPPKQFDPYLGDYLHLSAVGKDFYGVFCGSNSPKKANFPSGVVYQRNANWNTGTLLDVDNATPVNPSIDPFFFKVKG